MHVVQAHHPAENANLERFTSLPDQLSDPYGHIARQDLIPIFGHPDEVILDVVHRMASGPVVHFQSLGAETSPAKAGGLNPTFRESMFPSASSLT